jgi:hypothetical protein
MRQAFLLVSFIFLGYHLLGQDNLNRNYQIMVTPSQFFFNDYSISAEKFFGRHTIGLTLGYRPSTKSGGEIHGGSGLYGIYEDQNMWNGLYQAATIGLISKYYFGKRDRSFVDVGLFYRNWWFEKKYARYENMEGYRFDGLRTEEQNVYGLKLMVGHSTYLLKGNSNSLIIDFYAGIGIRNKSLWFRTYDGMVDDTYYDFYNEKRSHLSVGPQAGIKIGYQRMKRE